MSIFFQSSYSFPVILIHLILIIFVIFPESFSNLFMISRKCCSIIKAFIIIFYGFIFALLLFIQSRKSIYDPPSLKFVLWDFIFDCVLTQSNIKSLPLIDVSNLIWYLWRSDWGSISINSSSLLLIVISTLSLFECIMHSSSLTLEEINWAVIVNWMPHVSKFFRSFMVSFKYDLISLRYSSNDSIYFCHH